MIKIPVCLSVLKNVYLKGLKITTTVKLGIISKARDPIKAIDVTNKSKKFQPDEIYSVHPIPMIRNIASIKNTAKNINKIKCT